MTLYINTPEQLNAFINGLEKSGKIEDAKSSAVSYWNVKVNGTILDYQADTKEEAEKLAQEWFEQDQDLAHGEEIECDAELLGVWPGNDEEEIVERIPFTLWTQGYHGDFEEHFNQGAFI